MSAAELDEATIRREAIADERAKVLAWLRCHGMQFVRACDIFDAIRSGKHAVPLHPGERTAAMPIEGQRCNKLPKADAVRCEEGSR